MFTYIIYYFSCWFLLQFSFVSAQSYFATSYYPPIGKLPVIYPAEFIDQSFSPGLFGTRQYFQLDPVHIGVTGIPQVCLQNTGIKQQFKLDNQGHCFAVCTEVIVLDEDENEIKQIFCQSNAVNYPKTYNELRSSRLSRPQFYTINCTHNDLSNHPNLPTNWYQTTVLDYDKYTLEKALSTENPILDNIPNCFQSEMCFISKGLPKTVFDGPIPDIDSPNQEFYCCRTAKNGNSIYNVTYDYNCVASIYDTIITTQVAKQISCTRHVEIVAVDILENNNGNSQLEWESTSFSCSIQCVYPYVTNHRGLQNYEPQPKSIGCIHSDVELLCTLNVLTQASNICPNGEKLTGAYHYKLSEVDGNITGTYTTLKQGALTPDIRINSLFESRTWRECNVGELGCIPDCNCYDGCANHPQCNKQGTLWESPTLNVYSTCVCNSGFSGSRCEYKDNIQLCGSGQRINVKASKKSYFYKN